MLRRSEAFLNEVEVCWKGTDEEKEEKAEKEESDPVSLEDG